MAPIVALKGQRQVGKTTILNQTIQALLDSGVPPACIFRIQFDELPQLRKLPQPILELAWWYSNTILGKSFHKAASEGNRVFFFFDEIQRMVQESVSWRQVLSSLKLLDGTLLMKLIEPLHLRLRRQLGNYKVCLCDHALRATWLQELVPLSASELEKSPHLSDIAGRIAESAAGYFLSSISSIDIAHFPERDAEREVDFVLTIGDQRIPVEIKYRRRVDYKDTIGLRAFIEKAHYNAPFGVLVTLVDEPGSDDPRIVSMPLSTLLLLR